MSTNKFSGSKDRAADLAVMPVCYRATRGNPYGLSYDTDLRRKTC
jgi:hypothetical protein